MRGCVVSLAIPGIKIKSKKRLKSQKSENFIATDSLSSGSTVGTVVAFHGTPGSHNDFKYIRQILDTCGVRFIGVNYPGFRHTPGYTDQQHVNAERQSYSNALLQEINVSGGLCGKLIALGHSRGCENALMTAISFQTDGLIMVNPVGLREHKMIRPLSKLRRIETTYNYLPKFIANPLLYKMSRSAGLKVQDGEEAISSLKAVIRCGLHENLPYIHKFNEQDTKTCIIFAGNDHVVEREVIFESLQEYKGLKHFNFGSEIPDPANILNTFHSEKGATVFIEQDTHYQNKKRADLVANVVKKIFEVTEKPNSKFESELAETKKI
uniref:AB hydrolase-1 domain-containing protein n=1 Tax=Caenorhabditis japonica TaxID=281687 RepID=A0A8R1HLI7_CAEJA